MSVLQLIPARAHRTIFQGHDAVTLSAGDLDATFLPELGMVGASLRHRGDELLDRGEGLRAYRDSGVLMGIPLLHPWANRLAANDYALHGRSVRLPSDSPLVHRDERGLPIHGLVAAHRGWVVDSVDAGASGASLQATLDLSLDRALLAAFPFSHTLTVVAKLTESALTLSTTVEATGGAPVPIAFGFHPYLRIPDVPRAEWEVSMPRRRHLSLDGHGIPTGDSRRLRAARFPLRDHGFDDAFDEITEGGAFRVAGGGRTIGLTHDAGYPVAQVYSPTGAPFICFEPMTAPVNALRTGDRLPRAVPGRPFTATFSITVQAA